MDADLHGVRAPAAKQKRLTERTTAQALVSASPPPNLIASRSNTESCVCDTTSSTDETMGISPRSQGVDVELGTEALTNMRAAGNAHIQQQRTQGGARRRSTRPRSEQANPAWATNTKGYHVLCLGQPCTDCASSKRPSTALLDVCSPIARRTPGLGSDAFSHGSGIGTVDGPRNYRIGRCADA